MNFFTIPKKTGNKISYLIEEEGVEDKVISETQTLEESIISSKDIEELLIKANLLAGEKFATKNCSACHSFELPIKNKVGPSLAKVMNREVGSLESYKYSKILKKVP